MFSKRYVYIKIYILYTYMCVLCVTLMFRSNHIPEAEVPSVRFPKEYDLINLCVVCYVDVS